MRILLTGGSGQVGSALAPRLGLLGEVVAPPRAEFDLAEPENLAAVLDRVAPDLIVNTAAYTAVDRAEEEPDLAFRVNAESPGVIARWSASRGVPLIHYSTDYVFDGTGSAPWREDSPTGPLGVYGATKAAGDDAIARAGGRCLILRTSWVYAAEGRNFYRTILRLAAERDELRVVNDQIGAPTTADWIAEATALILGRGGGDLAGLTREQGAVVNLACGGETSWHGFAAAIVAGTRHRGIALQVRNVMPISTAEFPTAARRPANSRLDLGLLRERFGLEPPSWQDALDRTLDRTWRSASP